MKALSCPILKLWPMLKFFADKQADKQPGEKLHAPDLFVLLHHEMVFTGDTAFGKKEILKSCVESKKGIP